jgi:hypothetical protein
MELVNNELAEANKIAVLDPKRFAELPEPLTVAIKRRLAEASVPWVEADVGVALENFPGNWKESDYHSYNETHVLLTLRVDGSGLRRTIEWMHVCGPGCGSGARVVLTWHDDRWDRKQTARIKY